jgi:hypothetical protein
MSTAMDVITAVLGLLLFAVVVLGILALRGYNGLRLLSENVKEAWSNIGVTVRKQASLINQLISVVSAHAEGEKLVMLKVSDDASVGAVQQMHQQSGVVLSAVSGMAQRFPDLKSNTQYLSLMESINQVEDQLERQRQSYNASTKHYNVARTSIPHVFYSKLLGFGAVPYLDFDGASEKGSASVQQFASTDGERLNDLLGKAGQRVRNVTQHAGEAAVAEGRHLLDEARAQVEQDARRQLAHADDTVAESVFDITGDDATVISRPKAAPSLIDLAGSASGQRFALKARGQTIGRAAGADIIVADPQVSKLHAWIGEENGRWLLRDRNSSNGTYINDDLDTRIGEVELQPGLIISLGHHGDTRFEVSFA